MLETEKLQKRISSLGVCSRREAENLIVNKRVLVNNQIAYIGQRVTIDDEIKIDNQIINNETKRFYILLNKPKNTICTLKDPKKRQTIYQWMQLDSFCYSIGRLDFNTTGVIIITNDGEFANALAHPSFGIEREYIALLEKELSQKELSFLNSNFVRLNGKFSKQTVKKIANKTYSITLNEGRNHHIKNLFLLVNNYVVKLHRKRYGFLDDSNLEVGQFRNLKEEEVTKFQEIIKKSSS
ncbi:Ribosomal large subunit pseudouridine synthase B [Metamycoplasma auris 15026]|uniref:Pseudouridine synthase n=1 Tax=Metamycoplasma auris 15026 TaxID=1188233 RepID=N9TRK9_9BACT|nr:pseudouridine synthase [Metamycoplasma auris]ENY68690.1 Ribosomal large subunit pseudouridine synthase B [Metamycoplasma auris 15026]